MPAQKLSKIRIVMARNPVEILVIANHDDVQRGDLIKWIRENAPRSFSNISAIDPIMFGASGNEYVLGWRVETSGRADLRDMLDLEFKLRDQFGAEFDYYPAHESETLLLGPVIQ